MSETKTTPQKTAAPSGQGPANPSSANPAQKLITELKVSGHLMTLDAGLFCIFIPPGSAQSDPQSGFPGIRISQPPGPAFRPDAITISTFRDDGWLGGWNGAALVRVARGPAQLLVTIYQAPHAKVDAPKLQIMRLTEGQPVVVPGQPAAAGPAQIAAAPAADKPAALAATAGAKAAEPAAAPAPPPPAPAVPQNTPPAGASGDTAQAEMVAHIQTRGDVAASLTEWMGKPGSKHWIEGFAIAPKQMIGPGDIEYQAVLGRGWLSPWSEGGQFCGSRGMSLPILGLRVRLRGPAADNFDCALSASFVDGTRVGPLDNGEPCQSESLAPLEAFHLEIKPRGAESDAAATSGGAAQKTAKAKTVKPAADTAAAVAKPAAKPSRRK